MTTLHAGGKFDSKVCETSGGLHGVGVSVVNALAETLEVEVARGQTLYRQVFSRGVPKGKLETVGRVLNRRGTKVRFKPDHQIFGKRCIFSRGASSRWRARKPTSSAASRSAGAAPCPPRQFRPCARGGHLPLSERAEGLSRARHRGEGTGR